SKKIVSLVLPVRSSSRIDVSYTVVFLMSWSKIVGFEVSPSHRQFLDAMLESPDRQQVSSNVIQPEALTQIAKLVCRFHTVSPLHVLDQKRPLRGLPAQASRVWPSQL